MHLTHRPARRSRTALLGAALTAALAITLTACGGSDDKSATSDDNGNVTVSGDGAAQRAATVLDRPFTKPDLVLTDTDGKKYDLLKETKGRPTLLYFGYTNCPDVCPLTMSNIDVATRKLSKADRADLRVVFVTSDPERDTPKHLGKWLSGQGTDVVGLTGDFDTIQAGARTVGVSIEPSVKKKNGDIESTHGAQVLAFSPKDDKAHVMYDKDATAADYTKDMPKLIKGENP
ncbi:SCO family protein [Streptomyces sp. H27-D2]|uniref:SCO family protein n=1 Tax=Streptomyces sp. H27-D2 TaxID=3046304 RepID=UPI002DBD5E9F|nr:SCO family protein [Streptomyces sp. H27-D2]MEC4015817.1 SCO family protein [Streptomyces sp. H27-D2]